MVIRLWMSFYVTGDTVWGYGTQAHRLNPGDIYINRAQCNSACHRKIYQAFAGIESLSFKTHGPEGFPCIECLLNARLAAL